jgi:hypothetical protein
MQITLCVRGRMNLDLSSSESRRRIAALTNIPEATLRGWWDRGGVIPSKYFPILVDAKLATPEELVDAMRPKEKAYDRI